jgi:hypothetical protein
MDMDPGRDAGEHVERDPVDLATGLRKVIGVHEEDVAGFELVEGLERHLLHWVGIDLCPLPVPFVEQAKKTVWIRLDKGLAIESLDSLACNVLRSAAVIGRQEYLHAPTQLELEDLPEFRRQFRFRTPRLGGQVADLSRIRRR